MHSLNVALSSRAGMQIQTTFLTLVPVTDVAVTSLRVKAQTWGTPSASFFPITSARNNKTIKETPLSPISVPPCPLLYRHSLTDSDGKRWRRPEVEWTEIWMEIQIFNGSHNHNHEMLYHQRYTHCSVELEPVITSVTITTYLQHHCVPSHTSTAMWDHTYPDAIKRAPQHVCQLNPLRPGDRGGGPDRAGEGRVTKNRLKGIHVWLRHMLSLHVFPFFSFPHNFTFSCISSRQRVRPGQKTPLLLEETEHVAPLKSEGDAAPEISHSFTRVRNFSGLKL